MQVGGQGVHGEVALDCGELGAGGFAVFEVDEDFSVFGRREVLKREQYQVVLRNLFRSHAWKAFLSVRIALRILVFTVPSGSPVISAISEWVRPSKKAISNVLRCSCGSCRMTIRAFS